MRKTTPIWRAIATSLRTDLSEGRYRPGDKLPTEAQLSERFGVNRHTVRHALKDLIEDGLVRSRRGAGVFVTAQATDYPIGRRVRFHENLLAAGQKPQRRMLAVERRAPSAGERQALGETELVCAFHGLNFANDVPIALFESVFPLDNLPGLDVALLEIAGVTAALKQAGVADYTRASTRLTAMTATATQALHLEIKEGAPLLKSTGLNVDTDGRPVEFGRTFFAGERVTLTLDG